MALEHAHSGKTLEAPGLREEEDACEGIGLRTSHRLFFFSLFLRFLDGRVIFFAIKKEGEREREKRNRHSLCAFAAILLEVSRTPLSTHFFALLSIEQAARQADPPP